MTSTRSSLLLLLRNGDSQAGWQEFVELYRPLIFHAARKAGVATQDIEDVIQSVLLQLVKVLPSFSYQSEKGFFRSWLRRVTTHQAIDQMRKRRHESNRQQNSEALIAQSPQPDHSEQEFDRELLQAALKRVQGEFRQKTWDSFVLRYLEQKWVAQTAAELGLSENAVRTNNSRVLKDLREFCAFHGEELQVDVHFPDEP